MYIRIVTTLGWGLGLGLLLAGCQVFDRKVAPVAGQTAQSICASYGLVVDSTTYNTCVAYQQSQAQGSANPSVPPYRMDQYNNRVDAEGYRVDSTGRRMPVQSPYTQP